MPLLTYFLTLTLNNLTRTLTVCLTLTLNPHRTGSDRRILCPLGTYDPTNTSQVSFAALDLPPDANLDATLTLALTLTLTKFEP